MSDFSTALARLMTARGVGVRELARMVPCNPGHISNLRSGKGRPSAELAEILDEQLEAGGTLAALVPAPVPRRDRAAASWDDSAADEIAALDLPINSGRIVPSNYWRAREVIHAVAERGVPEAADLVEAYREACSDGERPALP